ncbi:MAG: hypothetical protein ACYDHP_02380 [Ferrimicrobium sp.]
MRLGINNPIYVVILIAHIGFGLVGYGSNAVAGWYADRFGKGAPRAEMERFFDGSISVSQWAVVAVPVVGVVLLILRNAGDVTKVWFLIAVVCWIATLGVLTARAWPAQRRLVEFLGDRTQAEPMVRIVWRSQQIVVVLYVVAFSCMLFKP